MDFKGQFACGDGRDCYPLTVLDDHSRYSLGLVACANTQLVTVQQALIEVFRRYGRPAAMLADNGPPWGGGPSPGGWSRLGVWLLRLDIELLHGRPWHPQTQGKDERFHRTLDVELLAGRSIRDRGHAPRNCLTRGGTSTTGCDRTRRWAWLPDQPLSHLGSCVPGGAAGHRV
jgi:transposase InsO family protein